MSPRNGTLSLRVVDPETDVVIVEWPANEAELAELERLHIPRLLVVASDSPPPACTDCLEDWVRPPVDESDVRAHLRALAEHRRRHHSRPTVDEYGVLRLGDSIVLLSPRESRLAAILIDHFGEAVRDETIGRHVFGSDDSRGATRVYVSRLRKHLAPLGFTISCIRDVGYIMHGSGDMSATAQPRVAI